MNRFLMADASAALAASVAAVGLLLAGPAGASTAAAAPPTAAAKCTPVAGFVALAPACGRGVAS